MWDFGIALKYFDFPHAQLESYDRRRATGIDYSQLAPKEKHDTERRFAKATSSNEWSPGNTNFGGGSRNSSFGDIDT